MVTVIEKLTVANFPIEIQGYKANGPFDTCASVSCIPYNCYRKFITKLKIKRNIHVKVTLVDGSNLGQLEMVLYSIKCGSHIFHNHFTVCQNILYAGILGLDFAKMSRNGSGWLYSHQGHKPLT